MKNTRERHIPNLQRNVSQVVTVCVDLGGEDVGRRWTCPKDGKRQHKTRGHRESAPVYVHKCRFQGVGGTPLST